jgi:hypothetical protein
MKIVALNFDVVRATPAVAEFVIRVELDGPAAGCTVQGRAAGPRWAGVTTVEVPYPMTAEVAGDTAVSLRCVIPEPNLWAPETPFTYGWSISVAKDGEPTDTRAGTVMLRAQ